jgi:hypothetical protein
MRLQTIAPLVAAITLVAQAASADVSVTIENGNVSVSAKDATVRQILTEWARVGQTRIVNVDRVAGPPLSIELTNVPEAQALDTLLRAVSGYLAAPRAVTMPNASAYDRIFILPTSTGTPPRPAPAAPAQNFTPPPFMPPPQQDDQNTDDEPQRNAVPVAPPNGQPRGPIFNSFPPPVVREQAPQSQQPGSQQQDTSPASYPVPTAPVGVSTPGMAVPVPQQPGQGRGNVR